MYKYDTMTKNKEKYDLHNNVMIMLFNYFISSNFVVNHYWQLATNDLIYKLFLVNKRQMKSQGEINKRQRIPKGKQKKQTMQRNWHYRVHKKK